MAAITKMHDNNNLRKTSFCRLTVPAGAFQHSSEGVEVGARGGGADHISTTVRKQNSMNAGMQIAFSFLFSPCLQTMK